MVLGGAVLHRPLLDHALVQHQVRRGAHGEGLGRAAIEGDEVAVVAARVGEVLGEEQLAPRIGDADGEGGEARPARERALQAPVCQLRDRAGLRADVDERARRVGAPRGAGVDGLGEELRLVGGRRRGHDEFHARAGPQQEVRAGEGRDRAAALAHRDAVHGHDLQRLRHVIDAVLQVEEAVRGGVEHAPELLRGRRRLQGRRDVGGVGHRHEVHREVLQRLTGRLAGRQRPALVAQHDEPLLQARDRRTCVLDALDDQRARAAAEHLALAEPMRMRVIPVHARRLVRRDLDDVVERRRRLHQGAHDVVLVTHRRHVHAVEMQVGRARSHHVGRAAPRGGRDGGRGRRRAGRQGVLQVDDQLIARGDVQRRGLQARAAEVAVALQALRVGDGDELQRHFEHVVLAEELRRRRQRRPRRVAHAHLVGRVCGLGVRRRVPCAGRGAEAQQCEGTADSDHREHHLNSRLIELAAGDSWGARTLQRVVWV